MRVAVEEGVLTEKEVYLGNSVTFSDKLQKSVNRAYSVLDKMDKMFLSNQYQYWVNLTIGEINNSYTFSTDSSTPYENLFIDINNKKSGAGYANETTISLSYTPDPTVIDSNAPGGINYIENVLLNHSNEHIIYQYGYRFNGEVIESPKYTGMLMGYTQGFQDTILTYNLTIISSITSCASTRLKFESREGSPVDLINYGFTVLKERFKEFTTNFKVEFDRSVNSSAKWKDISIDKTELTLFQYLDTIISLAVDENYNKNEPLKNRTLHYTIIDNNEDNYTFTILVYARILDGSDYESCLLPKPFNFMGVGKTIVKDFNATVDGTVLIHFNRGYGSTAVVFDKDGKIIETSVVTDSKELVSDFGLKEVEAENIGVFKTIRDTSYKATMSTMGIPCEIMIGTYIKVVVSLYNQRHSTSGIYLVEKISDIISKSGFFTEFSLIRIPYETNKIVGLKYKNLPPLPETPTKLLEKSSASNTLSNYTKWKDEQVWSRDTINLPY